jgi:hypothetical protein
MLPLETPNCYHFPDSDWLVQVKDGGAWYIPRPDTTGAYVPQFATFFTDGTISGLDYSYVATTANLPQTQTFTPNATRTVSQIGMRASGTSITARLETGAAAEIETVTFGTMSGQWATLPFVSSHTLDSGSTYHLVFSGTGTIKPMYKGSNYGDWPAQTYFADGNLSGFADQDLPFYMR